MRQPGTQPEAPMLVRLVDIARMAGFPDGDGRPGDPQMGQGPGGESARINAAAIRADHRPRI